MRRPPLRDPDATTAMPTESEQLVMRAKHCRELAALALDPAVEDTLLQLAADLEEEAKHLGKVPNERPSEN